MTLPKTYIGVDVAKDWIDVFTASNQRFTRVSNLRDRLSKWAQGLTGDVMLIFEATGRYDRVLIACLEDSGVSYARVNPLRARQFARAAGLLAKTDRLDARILCTMGEALRPERATPIQLHRQRLHDLQARRDDIVNMITAEQNRLSVADDAFITKDIKASIRSLTKRREALHKQINAHIGAHEDLNEQNQRLQSVPGVGPQTACHLMASMPELGQVNRRQIANLVGLAPHARESGSTRASGQSMEADHVSAARCIWQRSSPFGGIHIGKPSMAKCATMERLQKQPSSPLLDDCWSVSMR